MTEPIMVTASGHEWDTSVAALQIADLTPTTLPAPPRRRSWLGGSFATPGTLQVDGIEYTHLPWRNRFDVNVDRLRIHSVRTHPTAPAESTWLPWTVAAAGVAALAMIVRTWTATDGTTLTTALAWATPALILTLIGATVYWVSERQALTSTPALVEFRHDQAETVRLLRIDVIATQQATLARQRSIASLAARVRTATQVGITGAAVTLLALPAGALSVITDTPIWIDVAAATFWWGMLAVWGATTWPRPTKESLIAYPVLITAEEPMATV